MDKETFDDYFENRYKKQMAYYHKASGENQNKYKYLQWTLIILSASTPVLAAINSDSQAVKILLVVISAIVAILTTGLKTFNYQETWVNYRKTYEQLKPEIYYYRFRIGDYATAIDKEALFVTRVEAILDKEHEQWPPAKKLQQDQNQQNNYTPPAPPPPPPGNGNGGNTESPPPAGDEGNTETTEESAK